MDFTENHTRLAEIENALSELPIGYISRKVIRGKERFYHQWSEDGKTKSRYLKISEKESLEPLIEKRKALQAERKRLLSPLEKYGDRQIITSVSSITGYRLFSFLSDVTVSGTRDCYNVLHQFLLSDEDYRVCILYGLRRTGKTTLLRQAMAALSSENLRNAAYLSLHRNDTMKMVEEDLHILQNAGIRFVFIDNVTLLKDFISSASIFSDIFSAMKMKIVLCGSESGSFLFAEESSLYERCLMIHTTPLTYKEASAAMRFTIPEFLHYGGTFFQRSENLSETISGSSFSFQSSPFFSEKSTRNYIDQSIAANFGDSLENYEGGSHIGILRPLYEQGVLSKLIRLILENQSTIFLTEAIQNVQKSIENSRQVNTKRKAFPASKDSHAPGKQVLSSILRTLQTYQEQQRREASALGMTKEQETLLLSYLVSMDVFLDTSDANHPSPAYLSVTQSGMRFSHVQSLLQRIMQDGIFGACAEKEKAAILEYLLSLIDLQMLKDLVLMETARALGDDYYVFQLQFSKGSYDMVVYDKIENTCRIYLISLEAPDEEQIRFLVDPAKISLTENRFGKVCHKIFLCAQETFLAEQGVQIVNVSTYLKGLPII